MVQAPVMPRIHRFHYGANFFSIKLYLIHTFDCLSVYVLLQASGAYIFRPDGSTPTAVSRSVILTCAFKFIFLSVNLCTLWNQGKLLTLTHKLLVLSVFFCISLSTQQIIVDDDRLPPKVAINSVY